MRKRYFESERLRQAREAFQRDVVAPLWAEAERKALALAADDWDDYRVSKAADRDLAKARLTLAGALRSHRASRQNAREFRARLKGTDAWSARS
jgi:hypothetical protein